MGVNKVEIGDEVVLDLTADTVSEDNLLEGETAHNAAGDLIVGTASRGGMSIENAVILSEDQAAYILHEYSEISYVSGQRAIWSTIGSSVICQETVVNDSYALGYVNYMHTLDEAFPNGQPQYYTSGKIVTVASATAEPVETLWELYLDSYSQGKYYYYIRYSRDNGETWNTYSSRIISYRVPTPGIYFAFGNMVPSADSARPYGYIQVTPYILYQDNSTGEYCWRNTSMNFIPSQYMTFVSEAERNAAIALRYEPQTLTEIIETKEATG